MYLQRQDSGRSTPAIAWTMRVLFSLLLGVALVGASRPGQQARGEQMVFHPSDSGAEWRAGLSLSSSFSSPPSSLSPPPPPPPAPKAANATSPLDVLNLSPNHRILVRLFQRTRLIPTLIRLVQYDDGTGCTILAPTDESLLRMVEEGAEEDDRVIAEGSVGLTRAIGRNVWRQAVKEVLLEEADSHVATSNGTDNIQDELRRQLLHHVLNVTLSYETITNVTPSNISSEAWSAIKTMPMPIDFADLHSSLHFPSRRNHHEPSRPGPVPQPPEGPKHPGADDGSGLLGGEGQKVRAIWKWQAEGPAEGEQRGSIWFDSDAHGQGGIEALEVMRSQHGIVVSINGTVPLPPTLEEVVRSHKSLSAMSSLLDDTLLHSLAVTAHSTFFFPSTPAFDGLSTLEKSYLLRNVSLEGSRDAWGSVVWDRTKLVGWHTSGRGLEGQTGNWGMVAYASRMREAVDEAGQGKLTTILGGPLMYTYNASTQDLSLSLSAAPEAPSMPVQITEQDILIENGVIHIVDQILLPSPASLRLNVEKTLLALNASRFVGMMKRAGLEDYLMVGSDENQDDDDDDGDDDDDDDDEGGCDKIAFAKRNKKNRENKWTFIVPSDEVIDNWFRENPELGRQWSDLEQVHLEASTSLSLRGDHAKLDEDKDDDAMTKLANLLKYHIVPGLVQPSNLTDGDLVATELRDWRLKDGRQRILASVSSQRRAPGDSRDPHVAPSPPTGNGDVAFGDANVIADTVLVGDQGDPSAIIYLVSQLLTPPESPVQTAVTTSLSFSTFVAAVFSAELDATLKHAPGVTYLIPNNDAFAALGLTMNYLLLPTSESRNALQSVVRYHAIDRVIYTSEFKDTLSSYPTLQKESIYAGRNESGVVHVQSQKDRKPDEDGSPPDAALTALAQRARVRSKDYLTSTGVMHEIDKVLLPPDLDLTTNKLLKGARCDTFRDLVTRAGYGFILNGTAPTEAQLVALGLGLDDTEESTWSWSSSPWSWWTTLVKSGKKKRDKKHNHRHRRLFENSSQGYILLSPTDTAFTRVNLTYYLSHPEDLKRLVQLHIIPSPALDDVANLELAEERPGSSGGGGGSSPGGDGVLGGRKQQRLPLGLRDSLILPSLLDASLGGSSQYGKIAFRDLLPLSLKGRNGNGRGTSPRRSSGSGTHWSRPWRLQSQDPLGANALDAEEQAEAVTSPSFSIATTDVTTATAAAAAAAAADDEDDDGPDGPASPSLGYLVGISNSRGHGSGSGSLSQSTTRSSVHSANVLGFARESLCVARRCSPPPSSLRLGSRSRHQAMDDSMPDPYAAAAAFSAAAAGTQVRTLGGILTLSSVLVPYQAPWFHAWGWILVVVLAALLCSACLGYASWRWWASTTAAATRRRRNEAMSEAMEGEEE